MRLLNGFARLLPGETGVRNYSATREIATVTCGLRKRETATGLLCMHIAFEVGEAPLSSML